MSEVGSIVAKAEAQLMAPPAPRPPKRKREQTVLDEDDWTDTIEAIILRDYFPDIPKLENELEWLEAVRSKNPNIIQQAQANIAKRRAGLRTPLGQSPATFATPIAGLRTPAISTGAATPDAQQNDEQQLSIAPPNLSLDKFMAKHTSEDNASFNEILEGINKRRRERYAWAHRSKNNDQTLAIEDPRPQDGFGTSGQGPAALISWPYKPNNALYYGAEGIPYTEGELAEQTQGPPKQIKAANTRIGGSEEVSLEVIKRPERGEGYSEVATPSFTPGPDESPFMTWGELEATPLRLEEDSLTGPQFKVPDRKPKDVLAHRLADGARLNLQKRAALMTPNALKGLQGLTPRSRSKLQGGTPQLASKTAMSPAAHRLATSLRFKASSADKDLRASYSRSSQLRKPRPSTASVGLSTPGARDTPAILHSEPAKIHLESSKADQSSNTQELPFREAALKAFEQTAARREALKALGKITDDLLDI